jgi:hypothetical protein
MKKHLAFLLIAVFLVALASCGARDKDYGKDYDKDDYIYDEDYNMADFLGLDYALARALERRLGIIKPEADALLPLTEGRIPGPLPCELFEPRKLATGLTIAQAKQDTETLFAAIRAAYAGYEYFGGDAVFLSVKNTILAELSSEDSDIAPAVLQDILAKHLNQVINDGGSG